MPAAQGCPHQSTLTLFSKGVYIRKSLGFFSWEIKYKLCTFDAYESFVSA